VAGKELWVGRIGDLSISCYTSCLAWKITDAKARNCHNGSVREPEKHGTRLALDIYSSIFELIDMRSFSNLWYWIALAVLWSTASHWVLGVPFDMVLRARRNGGQTEQDLEDLVRINTNRMLYIARVSGLWILGLGCFVLTGLLISGFYYRLEIAQALFLLGFPMAIVALISLSTAHLIRQEQATGEHLRKRLTRHRIYVQMVGVVSIFFTALWGMYQNLSIGVLGG
jgi:hypothetical protein